MHSTIINWLMLMALIGILSTGTLNAQNTCTVIIDSTYSSNQGLFCHGDSIALSLNCNFSFDSVDWDFLPHTDGSPVPYEIIDRSALQVRIYLDSISSVPIIGGWIEGIGIYVFNHNIQSLLTTYAFIVQDCLPQSEISSSSWTTCAGTCVQLSDASKHYPTNWRWELPGANPTFFSGQNPGNVCFDSTGTYLIRLITTNIIGSDTTSQTITVGAPPLQTSNLQQGTQVLYPNYTILNACGTGLYYAWSPSEGLSCTNCPSPTAQPNSTTTYTCLVSDSTGCDLTCTWHVQVDYNPEHIYAPNVFTPDYDGVNDEFKIIGQDFNFLNLAIFDRWGQQLFYTEDPNQGWNGSFHSKQLPMGIYAYRLNYQALGDSKNKVLSGTVLILY